MKRHRFLLAALSIVAVLIFSFVLPAYLLPKLDSLFVLSEAQRDLARSLLSAIPTFLGMLVVVTYHNVEYIHVLTNRLWMWVNNSPVSWSLSAEYSGIQADEIDAVYSELVNKYADAEPIQNLPLEKLINLHQSIGGMIELRQIDSAHSGEIVDDHGKLLVRVFNLSIPFRNSEESLETLNYLLSNIIERHVQPQETKYTFRINFQEDNPYYGLFIRKEKIHAKDVVAFSCVFVDRHGRSEGQVSVSNKRLSLVTQNTTDFHALSKRYVSLTAVNLSGL
jgi:hypothetical protein